MTTAQEPQPPHPLHALTTSELTRYRRQLEHTPSEAAPAQTAAALTRALNARGITGIITAAAQQFAVISVTAGLTVDRRHLAVVHPCRPAPHLARRRHRDRRHPARRPRPPRRRP